MARKLNNKGRAALHRTCTVIAALIAVTTYVLVPVDGRGPIGVATLAAGTLGYALTRYALMRAYAAASRPATRAAK